MPMLHSDWACGEKSETDCYEAVHFCWEKSSYEKNKKKATGVREGGSRRRRLRANCPFLAKKTFLHVAVSWALGKPRLRCRLSPALFPRTAVCSNQRITGRSDQTGSGSERVAVGVEAPVGGIALWSVYNSGVSVVARACLVNITGDKWNPDAPSRPADPCSSRPVSPRVTLPIRPNSSLHPSLDLPPHAHLPESEPDLQCFSRNSPFFFFWLHFKLFSVFDLPSFARLDQLISRLSLDLFFIFF